MGKQKFYAVRKGRQPGIYDSWEQCKRQLQQTERFNSEFKSFSTRAEAEKYMTDSPSSAASLQPRDSGVTKAKAPSKSLSELQPSAENHTFASYSELEEYLSLTSSSKTSHESDSRGIYQLEFDGASKGNPGKAGAGALLRSPDGTEYELTEGLGCATNNVAEYRALILGLRTALDRGVTRISVKGDSKLVCQQVMERWAVKNEVLKGLCEEAKHLKNKFLEFTIQQVDREFNPRADALANIAVSLPETEFVSSVVSS